MAKVITTNDGITHLRGADAGTLCGAIDDKSAVSDGTLTCPECAKIALNAVELVTKAEKREWRKL